MDEDERENREALMARRAPPGAGLPMHLAGLHIASGLLVVAYAVIATLSTQVTIQQTLFRGYLLLLLSVAGFLLAALALAGVIGASLEGRAARRHWEQLPAGLRERFPKFEPPAAARCLVRLSAWGTCVLWLVAWAVIFLITVRLI